jgi:hypothetical protein
VQLSYLKEDSMTRFFCLLTLVLLSGLGGCEAYHPPGFPTYEKGVAAIAAAVPAIPTEKVLATIRGKTYAGIAGDAWIIIIPHDNNGHLVVDMYYSENDPSTWGTRMPKLGMIETKNIPAHIEGGILRFTTPQRHSHYVLAITSSLAVGTTTIYNPNGRFGVKLSAAPA